MLQRSKIIKMTNTEKNIIEFITKNIGTEQLALIIRRFKEQTVRMVLKSDEDLYNKDWISEGHYWLTELAETLDPQLEKDS